MRHVAPGSGALTCCGILLELGPSDVVRGERRLNDLEPSLAGYAVGHGASELEDLRREVGVGDSLVAVCRGEPKDCAAVLAEHGGTGIRNQVACGFVGECLRVSIAPEFEVEFREGPSGVGHVLY